MGGAVRELFAAEYVDSVIHHDAGQGNGYVLAVYRGAMAYAVEIGEIDEDTQKQQYDLLWSQILYDE